MHVTVYRTEPIGGIGREVDEPDVPGAGLGASYFASGAGLERERERDRARERKYFIADDWAATWERDTERERTKEACG